MLSEAQQERLTRVGPGTEMGILLRCYWMPVLASSQLAVGQVKKVRLLGEDLVLFRTSDGKPGMLEEQCPHRGTSLEYGCVDALGIRCPYHGWQFDAAGRCLEIPGNSNDEFRERISARAYPVAELGGLLFAYLGHLPAPDLPRYDLYVQSGTLRDIGYALIPCNWLQIMENSVDPLHVEWLHGHHLAHVRNQQGLSTPDHYRRRHLQFDFEPFDRGILKRRQLEGESDTDDDWATGHPLIFPNMLRVGSWRQHRFQIRVPVDDTHTLHFWYASYRVPAEQLPVQETIPAYEVPWQDQQGNFLLDYVDGQDIMSWVTQGAIADRQKEQLAESDRGIALYRKMLFAQLDEVSAGRDPMGIDRGRPADQIIEFSQEANKFGDGKAFLLDTLEMSHARYSPIFAQVKALLNALE